MKNIIEQHILKFGTDDSFIFVFPSDIASSLWLEKALYITKRNTLPAHRFIAWDTFKETAIKSRIKGKKAVSKIIRNLYALNLAQKNKQADKKFFKQLIPSHFSSESETFAPWLARILPQLQLWESKRRKAIKAPVLKPVSFPLYDAEDEDLLFLKNHYTEFLETQALFEPSWQTPPLVEDGNHYIIFFPEAIEDFSEYAQSIRSVDFISLVHIPIEHCNALLPYTQFENIREEIHNRVLQIEALIKKGVLPNDIAISVPDIETIGPYLEREFFLRNIPIEIRTGKKLGHFQAGRLFSLVFECARSNFSFSSVKALLLNKAIPWKDSDCVQGLIQFGIDYHCVSSWEENGKMIDVWEAAFSSAWIDIEKITNQKIKEKKSFILHRLKPWYRNFKRAIQAMVQASTFTKARTAYILFRNEFLDMDTLDEKENAIIARCVSELNILTQIEQSYPSIMPQEIWNFFVSHLEDTIYVPQSTRIGVHIFPYRVAAATPFSWHFVINASMEHSTVTYRQLQFLTPNKRDQLRTLDVDASSVFFMLYALGPYTQNSGVFFSYSVQGLSGYGTAHCFFSLNFGLKTKEEDNLDTEKSKKTTIKQKDFLCNKDDKNDPYKQEKLWFHGSSTIPTNIYIIQKQGLESWMRYGNQKSSSFVHKPISSNHAALKTYLLDTQYTNGYPRISATGLNIFSVCNTKWFLSMLLGIDKQKRDADFFEDRNLGLLYHAVLKETYEKIKLTDGAFLSGNKEQYKIWAEDFAKKTTEASADFKGPLAAPLLSMLAKKVSDVVAKIIDLDAKTLDTWIPSHLECAIQFEKNGIAYNGKIDRISTQQNDPNIVIIDYKSGRIPPKNSYIVDDHEKLSDYQIPFYVYLVENSPQFKIKPQSIEQAWFGNLKEIKYDMIINNPKIVPQGKTKAYSRSEFKGAENACAEIVQDYVQALQNLDFTRPKELAWQVCASCEYRNICRFTYTMRFEP